MRLASNLMCFLLLSFGMKFIFILVLLLLDRHTEYRRKYMLSSTYPALDYQNRLPISLLNYFVSYFKLLFEDSTSTLQNGVIHAFMHGVAVVGIMIYDLPASLLEEEEEKGHAKPSRPKLCLAVVRQLCGRFHPRGGVVKPWKPREDPKCSPFHQTLVFFWLGRQSKPRQELQIKRTLLSPVEA